jgi:hypothetical protein
VWYSTQFKPCFRRKATEIGGPVPRYVRGQLIDLFSVLNASFAGSAASTQPVVIETPHPYAPATVYRWDVEFPPDTLCMALHLDKRCGSRCSQDKVSVLIHGNRVQEFSLHSGPPQTTYLQPGRACTVLFEVGGFGVASGLARGTSIGCCSCVDHF